MLASVIALLLLAPTSTHAEADGVGYRDFAYSTAVSAPTGEKPQSKLWFHDAKWWGALWNRDSYRFEIYRYDWPTHTWSTTGTPVDIRTRARIDAKFDGARLYIASAGTDPASTDHSGRLIRFTYDAGAGSYTLDSGFPVTLVTGGVEAIVIDKDTTGTLWATWTRANRVYVTHATTDDRTWTPPYVLPVTGADNLTSDDISALVAYRGKIGVMWSNQNDDAMYFVSHDDGAPDNQWTMDPAIQLPEYADDHINLKSLQADSSGQVFAATKTSLNTASAPLILLLVLPPAGTWRRHTFGTVADDHTRPIVLIDEQNRNLYMFAAAPCCSGGVVYMKQAPLDDIDFPSGLGTPFIQSSTDPKINNPTSTKQNLNSATGLLVLAADDGTKRYLHNRMELASDMAPPETTIDSGPSGMVTSASASFTFSSSQPASTFECRIDGSAFGSCASPATYSGLADGAHTFEVRALDPAGNADPTPAARTWTIDTTAPAVAQVSPPDGTNDAPPNGNAIALFSEPMDPATISTSTFTLVEQTGGSPMAALVSYEVGTYRAILDPASDLATNTWYVARVGGGAGGVTDAAGNPLASDVTWSFRTGAADITPPDTTINSGPSGTVSGTTATFTFSSSEPAAAFECRIDGSAFGSCASPATYSGLADGPHTFEVRAIDAAGNVDETPAARSWTIDPTLFADGFESADFSSWNSVASAAGGVAIVQSSIVSGGQFAARLSAGTSGGSFAYARRDMAASQTELRVRGDFRVLAEGTNRDRNVSIFKLYDPAGNRIVMLYRQNLTGKLRLSHSGRNVDTTGTLALDSWALRLELHVIVAGEGASTVEVLLDGGLIYRNTTANLGTSGVVTLQIGNDSKNQAFDLVADNIKASVR